ncbi:MAG: hypothetical protein Ta2A_03860 [Treponemataceae bacterium]|nr:MAG: hypothetical protein Ta2A_03860 [Treponemataceae bacterium]
MRGNFIGNMKNKIADKIPDRIMVAFTLFLDRTNLPSFAVILLVVALVGAAIVVPVGIYLNTHQKPQKEDALPELVPMEFAPLTHPLLPPVLETFTEREDFLPYREKRSRWDEDEQQEKFFVPDSLMLEELHFANQAEVDAILEAAP